MTWMQAWVQWGMYYFLLKDDFSSIPNFPDYSRVFFPSKYESSLAGAGGVIEGQIRLDPGVLTGWSIRVLLYLLSPGRCWIIDSLMGRMEQL